MPRGQQTGRSRQNVRTTPPRAPTVTPPPTPPIYDVQSIQTTAPTPIWTTTPPGDIIDPVLLGQMAAESERFSPFATDFLQQNFGQDGTGLYGSPFDPGNFDPTLTSTSPGILPDAPWRQDIAVAPPTPPSPIVEDWRSEFFAETRTQIGATPLTNLADTLRYTGQSLWGGYDINTGHYFEGAFDQYGNLINPDLQPNMMSPEVAWGLGLSEQDRINMGYNPDYPYNLEDVGGPFNFGDGGRQSSGGRYNYPSYAGGSYPFRDAWGLTMWRI